MSDIDELKRDCPVGTTIEWNDGEQVGKTTCEVWEVAPGDPVVRAGKYNTVVGMKPWPANHVKATEGVDQ